MKKEEVILELLKSLNMGNSGCPENRVNIAISQYNKLVKEIIKEENSTNDGKNA